MAGKAGKKEIKWQGQRVVTERAKYGATGKAVVLVEGKAVVQ